MTDTTNESAPLLIYPRPTPSTPGAPVEGRETDALTAIRRVADLLEGYRSEAARGGQTFYGGDFGRDPEKLREAADDIAAEVRRLRDALAEAQRDGERRVGLLMEAADALLAIEGHWPTPLRAAYDFILAAQDLARADDASTAATLDSWRAAREDATTSTEGTSDE
jgi:hypothetical protein